MAIPKKDALLVPYVSNFHARVAGAPQTFALSAVQADNLEDRMTPYVAAVAALTQQRADGTRAKSQTQLRDAAKATLLTYFRELYAIVQASTAVTDANKTLVGVAIRSDSPRPVPAPTQRPAMSVVNSIARTVTVSVFDETSQSKRRKPDGAVSALVYSFIGAEYPSDPTLWQLAGVATKSTFATTFADDVPAGAQVWIMGAWMNRKGETGPISTPVSTNVQGGGISAQASTRMNTQSVKIAA